MHWRSFGMILFSFLSDVVITTFAWISEYFQCGITCYVSTATARYFQKKSIRYRLAELPCNMFCVRLRRCDGLLCCCYFCYACWRIVHATHY
ncbi:hypothetical protein GGS20DRAFT_569541 [Poronia punctata]|nr:hypothetical protein GGS20DRAFT_569541 [Poronia punctata]